MFKRANKITALLVAAAAVISLVPATGVNAADVKRIESEDGTVYNAVAYKDGKFIIDGEIDGKDEGVYFVNGGKYTELEDIDTGSDYGFYGSKYATVDGDDYYVDLTNGKVTDDSIAEDDLDDVASTLRKKIRKDNDGRVTDKDVMPVLSTLPGARFAENWYADTTKYTTSANATALNIYTDANGAYIDADYNVGKIKIKNAAGNSATLENTVDSEDFGTGTANVKVSNPTVLGQDKNYIYRLVDITINAIGIKQVNGQDVTAAADKYEYKAIQKISKAQSSDDINGFKFAKSVTTYALTDDDATPLDNAKETLITDVNSKYSVVNGKVVVYNTESAGSVSVATITLKTKAGYTYTDVTDVSTEDAEVVQIDADGNIWRLDSGSLYKFNNDEDWDKVYKVDGAMTDFTIYDKDNFVVWNEEDEVYSVVGGKTSEETETPAVTVGWVQNADSTWSYNKEDGTKATGWLNLNGTWYYLKADGIMATGWILDGATWYYTNASGAMQTGWINDNGTWYYTNASGAMLANTTVGGYVLGANGAWIR